MFPAGIWRRNDVVLTSIRRDDVVLITDVMWHDIVMTSVRLDDATSTSVRHHVPHRTDVNIIPTSYMPAGFFVYNYNLNSFFIVLS